MNKSTPEAVAVMLPATSLTSRPSDDKWQREHQAFLQLKPQLIEKYDGNYVVIHNGQVIDSGADDVALALRFFAQHGNVPVHIGLVSRWPERADRIPHYRTADLGGSV
jgi:hypothetical protein